jgi:hypothetical protein
MKRLLLITSISFGLISCFKSDNRDLGVYNIADGYIRYQVNNFPFEINGGYNSFSNTGVGVYGRKQLKSANVPATRYTIIGQLSVRKTINIVIITDSLKTGSYTTSTSSNGLTFAKIDSIQYSGNRPDDILNLNITRNSTGTIDGTFSGKLSYATTASGSTTYTDGVIANGVFQNVAITY